MEGNIGKLLIVVGGVILLIGLLIYFGGDKLNWLGRLPGDIRVDNGKVKVFFPITTMLIISVLFNLVIQIIRKLYS